MSSADGTGLQSPRGAVLDPTKQEKIDPLKKLFGLKTADLFAVGVALSIPLYEWSWWWLLSGTPILTYLILLGASKGQRILPIFPLWSLLGGLNLAYLVAGTSWLLWRMFAVSIYPIIFISCLFQFQNVADYVRSCLRTLLKELQFVNDKIAFFDIPALEIDTEVDGLFVVRGLTFELSSLTIKVHGIEVGIKLTDDMELALAVEKVTIKFFRSIEIGDVYGMLKGGQYEMQFGDLAERSEDVDGDAIMNTDTPLLRAASAQVDEPIPTIVQKMRDEMTQGQAPKDSSAKVAAKSMTQLSPDNERARKQYRETIRWIKESNGIMECRKHISKLSKNHEAKIEFDDDIENEDTPDSKEIRAAICSKLHTKPSIAHPPRRSIRVTTLQNLSPPSVRNFLHRLPMLLRLLLNPLSYFHPVHIQSITAAASGKWLKHMLDQEVFKQYGDHNAEVRRLHKKITDWIEEANFAIELDTIKGLAQVPLLSAFDIITYLGFEDVMIYRTLPKDLDMKQIVRLGGADATFTLPSYLLPHHEHLLPPKKGQREKKELADEVANADGKPKAVRAMSELKQAEKDECNVRMGIHVRLPAVLDQELLNFIAALVKATKVVEMAKEPGFLDREIHNIKDLHHSINKGVKDGMKKAVVEGIVNDQWIAKMVGKVTKLLETALGDLGYSGLLPISLEPYRPPPGSKEADNKLLP